MLLAFCKPSKNVVTLHTLLVQGVSENMQQLFTSTKIGCKRRGIKVIYQIQAYKHTSLLITKNPENNTQ